MCFHPHATYKDNRQQHHIKWAQTTRRFPHDLLISKVKEKKRLKKLTTVTRSAAKAPSTSIGNEVEFWCLYLCPLCGQKNLIILCNTKSMYMWSSRELLCLSRISKCSRRTNNFKWSSVVKLKASGGFNKPKSEATVFVGTPHVELSIAYNYTLESNTSEDNVFLTVIFQKRFKVALST